MAVKPETRVAALEEQVARLRRQPLHSRAGRAWLDDQYGKFANDPVFRQAMKLGRKYRESLRPRGAKRGVKR
jgi:hypothetical protein